MRKYSKGEVKRKHIGMMNRRKKSRRKRQEAQMLSGTAAMEHMHRVFDKYKYYPVRRGYNMITPFNIIDGIMLGDLIKAGIPTNTSVKTLMQRTARGTLNHLPCMRMSEGWQMAFFEDHADCKAFIEEVGPSSGFTVATVGNMDAAAVSMGGVQERSSFVQFASDESVAICHCYNADGTARHFVKTEGGVTVEEFKLVGHIQPEDPDQFWEDLWAARNADGPDYDTGSGWVDPE